MITIDDFVTITHSVLRRNLNDAQRESVCHEGAQNLLVVAGPGSGKTTVLVLRALRHVFVEGLLPEHILITTFTTKAANELRTRWLDWGSAFLAHLKGRTELTATLKRIDVNRCRIDTLDSIAQQALSENKLPGEIAPVVIEDATANLVLKRRAFTEAYNVHQGILDPLLGRYGFAGRPPSNRGEALGIVRVLCDRLLQDRVDLDLYAASGEAQGVVAKIAQAYWQRLAATGLLDFATLELLFLERLRDGSLQSWLSELHTLLIDEYQDTNPLQEEIYLELISRTACAVTVVGDDDQAMYRFRGGSVELFTNFSDRCHARNGRATRRIDMVTNYRSSNEIVTYYNSHICGDSKFSAARITPAKPEVVSDRGALGFPVLGLFRDSPEALAKSLAVWLDDLFVSRNFVFNYKNERKKLTLSDENALGDCVFLSHSVDEVKYQGFGKNSSELRFPGMLRHAIEQRGHLMFNPRGRSLRTVPNVQKLLGLVLMALDPDEKLTSAESGFLITGEARFYLSEWRIAGRALLAADPKSRSNSSLKLFIGQWQRASRGERVFEEPDWPILELLFKLITWIPDFQNDPEHQVWLEAITRAITSAAIESPYRMQIHQRDEHLARSRVSIFRDGLVPLAQDEVAVDEDVMPSVPRNRLQLMTIHQSKGLEFPLVIVDVASAFKSNHHSQAFRRFPKDPSNVALLEDDVEPFLPSPLRTKRGSLDRTFDDLVRLYYVAFSRPQSVLLLIGCEQCLKYGTGKDFKGSIPHVGMGWLRDGTWPWRQVRQGRGAAPVMVDAPFALI